MPSDTPSFDRLHAALAQAVEARWPAQVEWLETLVRFPSLRGAEAACQDWLAGEFAGRGWSVDRYTLDQVDMAGLPGFSPVVDADYARAVQVVATLPAAPAGGRSLILQGHIDVVPTGPREQWAHDPFAPEIDGDWMSGRGTGDMKVGVAQIVFALDALKAAGVRPADRVHVQTVSEEECTGNGALSTLARAYRADACLIPEAVGDRLLRAQLSSVWFRLRLAGRAAHILGRGGGQASAILAAYEHARALQDLAARASEAARDDRWFADIENPVTFSLGRIEGGDWIGMVPSWCVADCRLGVLPGQRLEDVRQAILDTVAACARRVDMPVPTVEWIGFQAEAYHLEPGGDAEATLAEVHAVVHGRPLEVFSLAATSDVRQYGLYYGIPALCYGSVCEGIHSPAERVHLPSMKTTTLTLALFIAQWCGVAEADKRDPSELATARRTLWGR